MLMSLGAPTGHGGVLTTVLSAQFKVLIFGVMRKEDGNDASEA